MNCGDLPCLRLVLVFLYRITKASEFLSLDAFVMLFDAVNLRYLDEFDLKRMRGGVV